MIHTIGRVLASVSGLLVTAFGGWAAYDFISKVNQAMEMQPTLTFMQIMQEGGALNLALVATLIIVGLNIFIPNCVLIRMLCKTSCASSACTEKKESVEVVKA